MDRNTLYNMTSPSSCRRGWSLKPAGILLGVLACTLMASCSRQRTFTHVYTTPEESWVQARNESGDGEPVTLSLHTTPAYRAQEIEGFGACFNELGWTSLSLLSETDRDEVIRELFHPTDGARLSVCRMPVGANDFSRDWYSYNETPGDFAMRHFSIGNDRETLIPFIKAARHYCPDLKLWASPWSPPSWMKTNGHYAAASAGEDHDEKYRNGLPKEKEGHEGTDMMIQEPRYLKAYALYFQKFIRSYADEGIPIFAVMPQNEFNSAQIFPSCCWTARSLATFIGQYLGPAMMQEGVSVMMGTMERANTALVDTVLSGSQSAPYITGVGFQWAGKGAIEETHRRYPGMKLLQTEQECGDGRNTWAGMVYAWHLMHHYLSHGVSIYDYWNISLEEGGISRWGWAQNSLVVVNPKEKTYRYTYEYYLLKHFSHYIQRGASLLRLPGKPANALAFLNPDGTVVLICIETTGKARNITLYLDEQKMTLHAKANSINTWVFNK